MSIAPNDSPGGVGNFLTSLAAQPVFDQAKQRLAGARLTRADNLVALHRVLGGDAAIDCDPAAGTTLRSPEAAAMNCSTCPHISGAAMPLSTLVLLLLIVSALSGCADIPIGSGGPAARSCDRNGDQDQRRAC